MRKHTLPAPYTIRSGGHGLGLNFRARGLQRAAQCHMGNRLWLANPAFSRNNSDEGCVMSQSPAPLRVATL